jgi:16S rRNA processing protein RimM
MATEQASTLRCIGRVLRPHGVRGELKVLPQSAPPERFAALKRIWIGATTVEAVGHGVEAVRFQHHPKGPIVLLTVEAVKDRDGAEALQGAFVFAASEDGAEGPGDAYAPEVLIGLDAVVDGTTIGRVRDVLEMPAHDVLVIARDGHPDVLVPVVPAFIETIDLAAGRLVITPIEGLIDE